MSVAGMAFLLWLLSDSHHVGRILSKCCLNITVLDTVYEKHVLFQSGSAVVCGGHNSPKIHLALNREFEVCP